MLDPLCGLSKIEKEWANIKEMIYKTKPKIAQKIELSGIREKFYSLIKSKRFLLVLQCLHLFNIFIFTLYWNRQSPNITLCLGFIKKTLKYFFVFFF